MAGRAFTFAAVLLLILVIPIETTAHEQTSTVGIGNNARPAADAEGELIVITDDDKGKIVNAEPGDVLMLDLAFQGGTGFNWYPDALDEKLLRLESVKTEPVKDKEKTGVTMHGKWYFKVLGSGETYLRMLYYRKWEGTDKALNSFSVSLHIK